MSKNEVLVIDFQDSFIFNIASELKSLGYYPRVVNYQELIKKWLLYSHFKNIVWGPGPGHPDEYNQGLKDIFDEILFDPSFKHLGICLGHQLILKQIGGKVVKRKKPLHGISTFFSPHQKLKQVGIDRAGEVQMYNSLIVELDKEIGHQEYIGDELVLFYQNNILTMQFHPESVATDNSAQFFSFFK